MKSNHHKKILWTAKDLMLPEELWHRLEDMGYQVLVAEDGDNLFKMVKQVTPSLWIGEVEGLSDSVASLLREVKQAQPDLPIILMSARASVEDAVDAIRMGVNDYVRKDLSRERLWASIEGALTFQGGSPAPAPQKTGSKADSSEPIGDHPSMVNILKLAKRIAPSRSTVLIQGESGTGKEVIARYIHRNSDRHDKPFIAVNCAALPETLLESELFGHEKGAFTGAVNRKKGKFELASGGTLLLDEISEMAVSVQAKLLRVLQEREIDRVGGQFVVPVDTRVIATTNRDLEKETKNGNFRLDLYYRLNVVPLHLPPLRERADDISALATSFLENHAAMNQFPSKTLSKEAENYLKKKTWPGNVRELENLMERAVLLIEADVIRTKDLEAISLSGGEAIDMPGPEETGPLTLRDMEKKMILQALNHHEGNRTHAAKVLGISVRTLRNKLQEYRKDPDEEKMQSHG